ncbi:MAG: hypothetical protein ACLFTW_12460 [Chitinispirillaceae bacterium]
MAYRNKLIMLCRRAEDVIDRWLDAVYFTNPDRKAAFTGDYYRRVNRTRTSSEEVAEESAAQS